MKRKLGDIADIRIGYQFRRKVEPSPDGAWRVLHIKDFDEDRNLDWNSIDRYDLDTDPSRYLVGTSDVLFLFRGVRLFAHAIERDEPDVLPSGHFYILRHQSSDLLPAYLAWTLNSSIGQGFIQGMAKHSLHMPYISKDRFKNFEVPLPPLDVQRSIVGLSNLQKREALLMKTIKFRREQLCEAVSLNAINTTTKSKDR